MKVTLLAVIAASILASTVQAEDKPQPKIVLTEKQESLLAALREYQPIAIKMASAQFKNERRAAVDPTSRRFRNEWLKNAGQCLKDAERGKYLFIPRLSSNLKVGEVGRLPADIGDPMFDETSKFQVEQIIDGQSLRAKISNGVGFYSRDVIVRKFSTSGMTDGMTVQNKINYVFIVTGTETYTTVLGASRTVFVLEPFDITPIQEFVAESQPKKRARK